MDHPNVPIMALTATASSKVVADCKDILSLNNPLVYQSSFNRTNLHYEVIKKDGKTNNSIAGCIANTPGSGIVYCTSRKDCEKLSLELKQKLRSANCNKEVSYYHAGLSPSEKTRRHNDWYNGIIHVLCATSAFGMGIDKGNVRYVIHHSLPMSIPQYYQESGRAGRDGKDAKCILYYNYNDKDTWKVMIDTSPHGSVVTKESKITNLNSIVRYCEDSFQCRRTQLLFQFGETFPQSSCGKTCDNW